MKLAEGVDLSVGGGKIKVEVSFAAVLDPKIEALKAKIQSGEIDPIKGTDLDKEVMIKAIDFLKAQLLEKEIA